MSERPAAATEAPTWGGWTPSGWTPWGKSLRGTTIDYGMGQKLVIDENGIGRFTDAAGESATWNPTLFGWQDEDGGFKDSTFGIPGMEVTAGQLDYIIESLVAKADEIEADQPLAAQAMRDRAQDLWADSHDTSVHPFPFF